MSVVVEAVIQRNTAEKVVIVDDVRDRIFKQIPIPGGWHIHQIRFFNSDDGEELDISRSWAEWPEYTSLPQMEEDIRNWYYEALDLNIGRVTVEVW